VFIFVTYYIHITDDNSQRTIIILKRIMDSEFSLGLIMANKKRKEEKRKKSEACYQTKINRGTSVSRYNKKRGERRYREAVSKDEWRRNTSKERKSMRPSSTGEQ